MHAHFSFVKMSYIYTFYRDYLAESRDCMIRDFCFLFQSVDNWGVLWLQAMESKLLCGGKNIIDHTNEQQRALEQRRQEIAEQQVLQQFWIDVINVNVQWSVRRWTGALLTVVFLLCLAFRTVIVDCLKIVLWELVSSWLHS